MSWQMDRDINKRSALCSNIVITVSDTLNGLDKMSGQGKAPHSLADTHTCYYRYQMININMQCWLFLRSHHNSSRLADWFICELNKGLNRLDVKASWVWWWWGWCKVLALYCPLSCLQPLSMKSSKIVDFLVIKKVASFVYYFCYFFNP